MDNINYWNNFYQYNDNLCPSQFAAFIVNEYPNMKSLIDFGCGSARDTIFFSQFYDKVIGIDSSSEAIKINNEKLKKTKKISFIVLNSKAIILLLLLLLLLINLNKFKKLFSVFSSIACIKNLP